MYKKAGKRKFDEKKYQAALELIRKKNNRNGPIYQLKLINRMGINFGC